MAELAAQRSTRLWDLQVTLTAIQHHLLMYALRSPRSCQRFWMTLSLRSLARL